MSRQRGWLYECGRCEGDVYVKNLRLRTDNSFPCEECKGVIERQLPPDGIGAGEPPSANQELGWCGCGEPERVEQVLFAYLGQDDAVLGVDGDTALLAAYVADSLGWTEHGGTVRAAWLTDDGREALDVLRSRYAADRSRA